MESSYRLFKMLIISYSHSLPIFPWRRKMLLNEINSGGSTQGLEGARPPKIMKRKGFSFQISKVVRAVSEI